MATVTLLVLDETKGAHRAVESGDLVVDAEGDPVDFSQTLDEVLVAGLRLTGCVAQAAARNSVAA